MNKKWRMYCSKNIGKKKNKEKGTKMGVDYAVGGNVYNIKTLIIILF